MGGKNKRNESKMSTVKHGSNRHTYTDLACCVCVCPVVVNLSHLLNAALIPQASAIAHVIIMLPSSSAVRTYVHNCLIVATDRWQQQFICIANVSICLRVIIDMLSIIYHCDYD